MARITVEKCLESIENRFELTIVASKRARQLALHGRPCKLENLSDKATVSALREIESGLIEKDDIEAIDREIEEAAELQSSAPPALAEGGYF